MNSSQLRNLAEPEEWDAWYEFLIKKHGLSKKPAFVGMSRGGEYAYTWARLISRYDAPRHLSAETEEPP